MSSTGQIVGGIVGAVVGFYTGVGPVYGAQVGMMIGGAIDPPDGPVINGPRLDDLSVQTATYGAFIPRNYGTIAQTGNIFWLKGDALTETPRAEESGGKGGPTSTTNLWDYSATFALGLSDCSNGTPIDGIRRIWINGQLFYDAGSSDVSTIIASNESAEFFTLYTGTDTQLPDPLMQADKGAANVPAYRGLAYIVFENLPLAKYNNSLAGAQIKVEIVKNGAVTDPLTLISTETTGVFPHSIAVTEKFAYVTNVGSNTFQTFDITSPSDPILLSTVSPGGTPDTIKVSNGYAYICNTGLNRLQIYALDEPSAPVLLGSVATGGRLTDVVIDPIGLYAYGVNLDLVRVQQFLLSDKTAPVLVGFSPASGSPQGIFIDDEYAYVSCLGTGKLHIYNILAGLVEVGSFTSGTDIASAYVEGGYAYLANYGTGDFQVVDVSNPSAPTLAASVAIGGNPYKVVVSGKYAYLTMFNGALRAIDISDPLTPTISGIAAVGGNCLSIDVENGLLYAVKNASTLQMQTYIFAPNSITGSSVTLSSIVESECLTSKLLTAGDLDVTELTDSVRGYRIASLGALRGGIDPLRAAWPFDVVQHGYQIKFKRRGSASVATIDASELDARAAGESPGVQITNSREMDTLLPSSLRLKYIDSVREYDTNEQISDRGL